MILNNLEYKKGLVGCPEFIKGITNIKENPFISDSRKKYFLENYNNLWKFVDNNTIIYLFLPNQLNSKWKNLISLMFWRINFMKKIFNNNKYLEVWVFPGNHKKRFNSANHPTKTLSIAIDDINSGSTTYTKDNGIICLWRKEEILKVLLHEIIHSFKIDKDDPIPEAYVELRALIANIYLELLERQIPLNNFNKMYKIEKQFAVEQSKKILDDTVHHTNTNIHYYISEKGRILHGMNKKEWEKYLEKTIPNKFVNKNCLRFTITDKILQDYPRKDMWGKILNF